MNPSGGGCLHRGPRLAGGFPSATLAILRPLAAGSARLNGPRFAGIPSLAPHAAPRNPPHRLRVPGRWFPRIRTPSRQGATGAGHEKS